MRAYIILFLVSPTLLTSTMSKIIKTTMSPSSTFRTSAPPPAVSQRANDKYCSNPVDVVFVIDSSNSINDADFLRLKTFVANLIDNFDIGRHAIHVGIIVYSTLVGEKIGLFPEKNKFVLKALVSNLTRPKYGIHTAAGIQAAREMIGNQGRPNASNVIVVITEDRSTNQNIAIVQAKVAKALGITLIAIGVGEEISWELSQIASSPKHMSVVADYRALENTVDAIRDLVCTSITTRAMKLTTMMPQTPQPSTPQTVDCSNPGDIVFVIDGSDSINDADFVRLKTSVVNLVDKFEIGPNAIHVGVIVYSTVVGETISLIPPKGKFILKALVSNLNHPKFGTDTAAGLQAAREMIDGQGTPNAQKVIVVITDGRSTNPNNTFVQANLAKTQGITLIAIGVGQHISDELRQIASSPTYVTEMTDFKELVNAVDLMRDLICSHLRRL